MEAEIHDLETRDGEIDALLCDESVFTDVARLMELNKEKEDLAAKLEVLYENGKSWRNNASSFSACPVLFYNPRSFSSPARWI